jgi:hypothetical protein
VVFRVKLALKFPTITVTAPVVTTALLLEFSLTTIPPLAPGGVFSVTMPDTLAPPSTDVGVSVSPVIWNGFTVSVAVWETPAEVAVIVTD